MKKAIVSLLIVLLAFLSLCAGMSIGRRSVGHRTTISYEMVPKETTPPSETTVNINTATIEELMTLPGIGETLAVRIVKYRTENGPFERVDELMLVDGIGLTTLESIRNDITIGG